MASPMPGTCAASTSPPMLAIPAKKSRRSTFVIANLWIGCVMSRPLRRGANGRMDALITAAAAEIANHGGENLLVRWRRRYSEQRRRLHDLPGLTVTTLRNAHLAPGHLHGMLIARMQAFDR